jgi:hypothetical protein
VPRRRDHWTLELCVDAVRRYFAQLPARQAASKKGYLAWSTGDEDAPAPSVFDRYGGWAAVSKLARGSDPIPHVPTKAEKIDAAVLAHRRARADQDPRCAGSVGRWPDDGEHRPQAPQGQGRDRRRQQHATGRSVHYVRA